MTHARSAPKPVTVVCRLPAIIAHSREENEVRTDFPGELPRRVDSSSVDDMVVFAACSRSVLSDAARRSPALAATFTETAVGAVEETRSSTINATRSDEHDEEDAAMREKDTTNARIRSRAARDFRLLRLQQEFMRNTCEMGENAHAGYSERAHTIVFSPRNCKSSTAKNTPHFPHINAC